MNTNKPAIWIEKKALDYKFASGINTTTVEQENKTDLVPLYTNPAELTDEEIISCAEMDFVREELTRKTPEYMWIMEFAKAILRKAQEK